MTFKEYQEKSRETAIYPRLGDNYIYPALGLADEAGEVLGKVKKVMRDKDEKMDDESRKEIGKELGDVLWYLTQFATEINLSLEDIAQGNTDKLQSRMQRGVLTGSGDNR